MIQKIGLNLNNKKFQNNITNNTQNPINIEKTEEKLPMPSSGVLKNYYVSFGGSKFDDFEGSSLKHKEKIAVIENNTSHYGEKLLEASKEIAKKHQHSEVTHVHVFRAGLESILNYINGLNSGEILYEDESTYSIPLSFEHILVENIFKDKSKRDALKPVIENEIKNLDEKLEKMPKNGISKKIEFSKDYINELYSVYAQENAEEMDGDGLVHDDMIFNTAIFPNNDTIRREFMSPFRKAMKDVIYLDNRPMEKRIHLSFYDDKATNIWKNLAVGTNMAILYDKELKPDYMVNSVLSVFEKSEKGFGKLNKNNTKIVNFNDTGKIDKSYVNSMIREFGKDKDKNYVIIMSIMDHDLDTLCVRESNIEIFAKAPSNVKFVMVANKDNYYQETNDKDIKEFFSDFGEISIPLMNMSQAQEMFREQPKLIAKLKKQFSKQAIEKCVEAANQLKGNYPEKAQKVMDLVAAYYVDKKDKITATDVQNYIKEASEIFKPVENDNSVKIVFDTNIKLKDMVGTPSTKKEAKSIVERIKDKSIGTKGYIIYSQDGSIGAGRKYTAQAIAGETKSPYVEINAVDFGTKDVDLFGMGNLSPEASMKKLFGMVKAQAETNSTKSAILFIENFEYFSYGEMVSEYHEKAMSQLIREMNKAQEQGLNIIVMGSMSNPDFIGEAATKSFKFIDKIEVDSPGFNSNAREEVIKYYLNKKGIKLDTSKMSKDELVEHIKLLTEKSSYVAILTLLDKAKNVARERKHRQVSAADFTEALLQIECGRPSIGMKEEQYSKDIVTSHECGHALNHFIMEELVRKENIPWHNGNRLHFITLDPRSWFGGAVFSSEDFNKEWTLEKIFADVVSCFGGHSCEKKFFGIDGSYGITTDMLMATDSATMAAGIMGTGSNFGKKSLNGMWVISEEDKNKLNKDIDVILKNAMAVSDAITEVYADFNKEFVKRYSERVGTGDCIIHRDEFIQMFNEWKAKQTPEKLEELELLNNSILRVINATRKGIICYKK